MLARGAPAIGEAGPGVDAHCPTTRLSPKALAQRGAVASRSRDSRPASRRRAERPSRALGRILDRIGLRRPADVDVVLASTRARAELRGLARAALEEAIAAGVARRSAHLHQHPGTHDIVVEVPPAARPPGHCRAPELPGHRPRRRRPARAGPPRARWPRRHHVRRRVLHARFRPLPRRHLPPPRRRAHRPPLDRLRGRVLGTDAPRRRACGRGRRRVEAGVRLVTGGPAEAIPALAPIGGRIAPGAVADSSSRRPASCRTSPHARQRPRDRPSFAPMVTRPIRPPGLPPRSARSRPSGRAARAAGVALPARSRRPAWPVVIAAFTHRRARRPRRGHPAPRLGRRLQPLRRRDARHRRACGRGAPRPPSWSAPFDIEPVLARMDDTVTGHTYAKAAIGDGAVRPAGQDQPASRSTACSAGRYRDGVRRRPHDRHHDRARGGRGGRGGDRRRLRGVPDQGHRRARARRRGDPRGARGRRRRDDASARRQPGLPSASGRRSRDPRGPPPARGRNRPDRAARRGPARDGRDPARGRRRRGRRRERVAAERRGGRRPGRRGRCPLDLRRQGRRSRAGPAGRRAGRGVRDAVRRQRLARERDRQRGEP